MGGRSNDEPSVLQIILDEVRAIRDELKTYATREWVREQVEVLKDQLRTDIAEARTASRVRDDEIAKTVTVETTTITKDQTRRDNIRKTIIGASWAFAALVVTSAAVVFGPIIDAAITHGRVP